jgi:chaperonin GroEL
MKILKTGKENLEKVYKGFNEACDAVSQTVGPKGRNVFIDDQYSKKITNDGVTVANAINLEDPLENIGAWVVKNTASQMLEDVGDGTTTTVILLQSIVKECLKRPENVMTIKGSLKEAGDKVLKILSKKSIKIKKEDIEKVALISAEDKDLAKMIAEMIKKLGDKAVINVQDSKTFATEYEIVDGYELQTGFVSPYFINDKKTGKAVYENIHVLVVDRKIANISDISHIHNQMAFEMKDGKIVYQDGKPVPRQNPITQCVIVGSDIDASIVGLYVQNNQAGMFNSIVIQAGGMDLEDVAGATGATIISEKNGIPFKDIKLEHLGNVSKVVCDKSKTLFVGNTISGKLHAQELDKQADNEPNMYIAQKMRDRANRMRGGVGLLKIGAATDLEREYLKAKAEDAVKATTAALEEGVVEGGGMALWRISNDLIPKTIGERILQTALQSPLRKIIENAGEDYTEVILHLPEGYGYDAKENRYVEMVKEGIIDPAKVERLALENAVSAASTLITMGSTIVEIEEKK